MRLLKKRRALNWEAVDCRQCTAELAAEEGPKAAALADAETARAHAQSLHEAVQAREAALAELRAELKQAQAREEARSELGQQQQAARSKEAAQAHNQGVISSLLQQRDAADAALAVGPAAFRKWLACCCSPPPHAGMR